LARELVFVVFASLIFQGLLPLGLLLARAAAAGDAASSSGAELERVAARALWLPLLPVALGVSAVVGWVIVEPPVAERLPVFVMLLATPALLVAVRAFARAVKALFPPPVETAATLGLVAPRVVVAPAFVCSLDDRVRHAVIAHELAHARHRDPLRLWIAHFVADLQWPAPSARTRLERWREALELARDEEARAHVQGADLAAGVLSAVRVGCSNSFTVAGVVAPAPLRRRIERLLAPLPSPEPVRARPWSQLWFIAALVLALQSGMRWGEAVVQYWLG
jgi:hypothetical protein